MRQRRKRSAAITLVLAGTITGCSEPVPQRDVYASLVQCQNDWPSGQACEPVRDARYSQEWYYGPSYYGRNWPSGRPRASDNALEAFHVPTPVSRTATASRSSPSMFSSSSTRSGSSSSATRGGFGSSAHSSGG